eukprot:14391841-Alexandrium_andersonii.AAC.1
MAHAAAHAARRPCEILREPRVEPLAQPRDKTARPVDPPKHDAARATVVTRAKRSGPLRSSTGHHTPPQRAPAC